ncbi:MAG: glycosyltransferase family 2 protein [Myxococcota bacterium]
MPAHNEEEMLRAAVAPLPAWIDGVIIVDDASTDKTSQVAESLAHGDPRIHLRRHSTNRGVGAAVATGYRTAFRLGAQIAVVMAGDAQMDPDDLPSLITPITKNEADYVKGNRLAHPQARKLFPSERWLANHALSWLTRRATGLRVNDSQCGYTALCENAYGMLQADTLWPRYGYPNDILIRLGAAECRIRDEVVRPVYGEEHSEIKLTDALIVIPILLMRGWMRRVLPFLPKSELPTQSGAS